MTHEEIREQLEAIFESGIKHSEIDVHGDLVVHVQLDQFLMLMGYLKQNRDYDFDYLSHITGVDYLEQDRDPRYDVVYELYSMSKGHHIRVHVGLPEEEPTLPSVYHLWHGADFPERELYDLFGFIVMDHPNMKRLIMPEGWEGYPLLKDYPLTVEEVAFSHNREHKSELIKTAKDVKVDPWA
ncbi:MAG: NADH-quinone oxidoreductase subunit C [Nitrospinaceae bacterium]|nr:NADH-quinone oxidoreductase subunit C [Nitrospinaceae bacterium]NIR54629.1 NADH-quinone oxidoreductase subunit C [Nitrospinaceae bacterium]NIS85046.1 NADH-quinone oxidoreductase subunit C [Nitrospinaceae bacterium]NIT81862.1 NADH-quinone oxidoreductase subunit C [Nitrospinaceae bacterium]NIU44127.1 NADH-quinone oxidoreductase subunit C [Nitrospinaceae bacterium]